MITDNQTKKDDVYFAVKDAKDTASILLDKSKTFYDYFAKNDYLEKMKESWRAYHGFFGGLDGLDSHTISFTGEQGELVKMPVNHFRNIAQHIYVMVTSNRPSMEARAVNTDYKSMAQTYLANGILDYYMREKKLEDAFKKACEMAIVMGSGYIKLEWNATSGNIYDINDETGLPIYEGDAQFTTPSPLDVVVDGTKESWNNDWACVRSFRNRFDLAAKYPELAKEILDIPTKDANATYRIGMFSNDDTDDIPVFEFYHKSTDSVPEGRYMFFASPECVFLDTKLPYRSIPLYRIVPGEIMGTPYGYTPMFDIMPIQDAINAMFSTILTNQNAFGVQNLFVQRGADIAINSLAGGLNIIEGNFKPEPLQLTETPAEIFKFLEILVQTAETISGVNSVARGNPEASLKSGTALALVQSMALQFISGLQQSYVRMIEDVGTALLDILKDYAMTPTVIALVGKNNRPLLKEFTGDQIDKISRVVVDIGNPLARTISGRVQIAEQLLQMKAIKSPQQYFQVLNTGRLDAMFEGDMSELLLVKSENEKLMDGQDVMATMLDQHSLHIMEHKSVLADPDLRNDHSLVQKVMQHIQEHITYLRTADPQLLQLVGETPMQPLNQPQGSDAGDQGALPQQEQSAPQGDISKEMNNPQGNMQPGEPINNGGQTVRSANLPKVDASLLSNPALQEAAMGNVRQ